MDWTKTILPVLVLACTDPGGLPTGFENARLFEDRELIFLRDAVLAQGDLAGAQPVPGDRSLLTTEWEPGESIEIQGLQGVAPQRAECLPLFQIDLGDVSRHIAMGGTGPHTGMAWSPDGSMLAIGSFLGELWVVDGWSGEVLAHRSLSESTVKRVSWSPNGQVLYAAEQSPDAYVHALEALSLETRWSLRLADRVESSPAPAGEDVYGVYSMPAAYGLEVLESGELIVVATHAWHDGQRMRNLSQLLRISAIGEIVDQWPDNPVAATLMHPSIHEAGDRVTVNINHSADSEPPSDLPVGGVQVLRLSDLQPLWSHSEEPLKPHYQQSFIWGAVEIEGDRLAMGFGDGRVRVVEQGAIRLSLNPGTPVLAGSIPISAAIDGIALREDSLVLTTMETLIPYGAAAPELRPPTVHPRANTLQLYTLSGELEWNWTGPYRLNGMSLHDDGRTVLLGAGPRNSDHRRDLYGALVLDLEDRELLAHCPTEGPAFFLQAMAPDGRIAITEYPARDSEESIFGSYRVGVYR
jgi:hypothetical protein